MSAFEEIGIWMKDFILSVAAMLKDEFVPGLASIVLILALILCAGRFVLVRWQARSIIRRARRRVEAAGSADSFSDDYQDLIKSFEDERKRRGLRGKLAIAWCEYAETIIHDRASGEFQNSIRPPVFFNVDDLSLGLGTWRIVPGLFVSVGLFLTFLGLVAALQQSGASLDSSGAGTATALQELLRIASAKFVMSLTGLLMSILMTVALRLGHGWVEHEIAALCDQIERKLAFVSLEQVSMRQTALLQDQNDQLKGLTTTLVSEIGVPLRQELPQSIGRAIQDAMAPAMDRVGDAGAAGMSDMVQSLSDRLVGDVGSVLGSAATQLGTAADRLESLAQQMQGAGGRMGGEMEAAIARMTAAAEAMQQGAARGAENASATFAAGADALAERMTVALERIRENTEGGAQAMERAAAEIAEAARAFGREIEAATGTAREMAAQKMEAAGQAVAGHVDAAGARTLEKYEAVMAAVSRRAETLGEKARDELLEPLAALRDALAAMAERVDEGAGRMARLADGVERGAGAAERAAGGFSQAADAFRAAADPVANAAGRLASAAQAAEAATRETAAAIRTSARSVAEDAANALAMAREALGGERAAIAGAMSALEGAIVRFRDVANRHDEIDAKLGRAFQAYQDEVRKSLSSITDASGKIYHQHADAIDRLRILVESAREFDPESSRR